MTLLFMDSFDHYANHTQMLTKWNSDGGTAIRPVGGAGRNSTQGIKNNDISSNYVQKTLTANSTFTVGFAMWSTSAFQNSENYVEFHDSGTAQIGIYITSTGAISVRVGGAGGTTLATSSNTMSLNAWYYIEFKFTIANAGGAYEVRVDGDSTGWVPPATGDTQNTGNNTANAMRLGVQRLDWTTIEDLYICNGDGSENNTFLGDIRVVALYPDGVGNSSQWVPTPSGDNYTCVDETTPNGDTDYVATSGVGYIDTYTFGNLPVASGTILGIQHNIYARKDDAGVRRINYISRVNNINYSGSSTSTLSSSYIYYTFVQETNPDNLDHWIIDDINDSEFGTKLEA